jgi:hypothetical protein
MPNFVGMLDEWNAADFAGFQNAFGNQLELAIEASVQFADQKPY